MHSLSIITTILALFTLAVKASETSGNLDLCFPKGDSGNAFLGASDEQLCLDSVGSEVKMSTRTTTNNTFHWQYDNGLLRAPNGQCLGPLVKSLRAQYDDQYELVLQECPNDDFDESDPDDEDESLILTDSRRMRFVITDEGRVQSLARVKLRVRRWHYEDKINERPYCLTMAKEEREESEKAYLVPCHTNDTYSYVKPSGWTDFVEEQQVFDVYGDTYSGSFVFPLSRVSSTDGKVRIAYQIGLPLPQTEVDFPGTNFIEITSPYPGQANNPEIKVLDTILLEELSGIVSYRLFDSNLDGFAHQINGKITATLRTNKGDDVDGDDLILDETFFFVNKNVFIPVEEGSRPYMIYIYIGGCFVTCFMLSVMVERYLAKRFRAVADNHDGKTVCMSLDEDEKENEGDFPLEDNVEEGFGVIHICIEEDSPTASLEIDENRV